MVKLPRKKPVLKKCYFVAETAEGLNLNFKKIDWQLLSNPAYHLIEYIGEDSVAKGYPHRYNLCYNPCYTGNTRCVYTVYCKIYGTVYTYTYVYQH